MLVKMNYFSLIESRFIGADAFACISFPSTLARSSHFDSSPCIVNIV